jgi:hypothetical protein
LYPIAVAQQEVAQAQADVAAAVRDEAPDEFPVVEER